MTSKRKPPSRATAVAAAPDPLIAMVDELGQMQPRLEELRKLEARADVIKGALKSRLTDPAASKLFSGTEFAAMVSAQGLRDVFRGPAVHAAIGDKMWECCELYAAKLRAVLTPKQITDCSLSQRIGPRTITVMRKQEN